MPRQTLSREIRRGTRGRAADRRHGRLLARILSAALVLTLSACVNLAPATRLPPPPIAGAWPDDAETAPAAARALRDLDWANYFQDGDMRRLIGLALEHNRDLRLAELRVREAEAAHRIQRADLSPSISAQGGIERSRVPGDLNLTGQPQIQSRSQAGIGLTHWEIDLWGRIRNLNDAALDDWLATDAARQAVRVALVRQVADSVLVLRELDQRAFLADEAVRNRRQSLEIFRQRKGAGSASELELTQVRTLLIQAESLQAQLQQERAAAAHALTLLTGVADADIARVAGIGLESMRLTRLEPGLPSEVLLSRPDIRAAEYQLRSAHARIGAARAAFLPRIALTSSAGSASAELDGLFGGGSQAWTFAPVIELPIFTAGRLRATLDVAEVRRDMAVATYEKSIQTAFHEVADALSARQGLARQLDIQARMAQTQAARADLAQLRYDSGAAPYLEVLDARRDLLTAQQQLVQVRRAWLSSQVALYATLGGGAGPAPPTSPAL
ncbi:MAG: efflux transporter outer membrane subunit [Castellaniella sp.]|uniref:efflux transporter outer membrane subunit n=1 Tax=Castellaniella sp. TaxID=1955812 RepID=UPI0011F6278F|nr:efflux transporter outer membrane subunit [Castellaniella sp.]TAN30529.1 MAG: efflux transporter outer membrane subunit [Castellaniella sp.]